MSPKPGEMGNSALWGWMDWVNEVFARHCGVGWVGLLIAAALELRGGRGGRHGFRSEYGSDGRSIGALQHSIFSQEPDLCGRHRFGPGLFSLAALDARCL